MIDKDTILETLKYGERINLECKKAEGKLPNSVWETYSSFANTDGGLILIGVEEDLKESDLSKRFSFVNIENIQQRIADFWNTINSDKVNVNILVDANVGTCEIDGKDIMWIEVPRATYKQRPVYINGNPMKGSFKRNNEGDYHCSEDEVKAMFRDANDSGNDGTLLVGYTMEDIDLPSLRSYRIEFEHQNPEHIWNGLEDKVFLEKMSGCAKDRSTGKEWLTTAGLLMFGKGLSVQERFDNIRMDYIDKSDLREGERWSDRLTYDGLWENNLYNFVRQVMPRLIRGLKRPFRLAGMVRVDDTAVHKAVREAVVNMVIHSDYMITGVLKITKSDEGFEFSNPGLLKLPVEEIYSGGHSVARNPRIQKMFRMIGLGDNIGSGFPTILHAWGDENWRRPDLSQNEALDQVDLKLWMVSLMPEECSLYLKKLYGEAYLNLHREAQIILGTAYLEGAVTNRRLQSILDLHRIEIGQCLAELVRKGMLIAEKKGRWTRYELNREYEQRPSQMNIRDLPANGPEIKNETDKIIYDYIKVNGFITSAQVIDITRIKTIPGATKALGRLRDAGLIKKVQQGRSVIYQLID